MHSFSIYQSNRTKLQPFLSIFQQKVGGTVYSCVPSDLGLDCNKLTLNILRVQALLHCSNLIEVITNRRYLFDFYWVLLVSPNCLV